MDEQAEGNRTGAIVARIGRMIDEGLLQPGRRMASLRSAAGEYGVSKNTMVEVYDRLVASGRLEARRGAGFYVRAPGHRPSDAPPPHMTEAIDIVSLLRERTQGYTAILLVFATLFVLNLVIATTLKLYGKRQSADVCERACV